MMRALAYDWKHILFGLVMLTLQTATALNLNLLTITSKGKVDYVSISDYDIWKCEDSGKDRKCSADQNAFMEYVQDNAFWSALNIVAFVVVIFFIIGYIIFCLIRCCCKCCRSASVQDTDSCSPSPRESRKPNKAMVFCKTLTVVGVVLMFFLSTFLGSYGLEEKSSGLLNAPGGAVNIMQLLEPKVTGVIVDSTSGVIAPALVSLNGTINTAIDVPRLAESMQVLNSSLPLIPDISRMIDTLNHIANITGNASSALVDEMIDMLGGLDSDRNRMGQIVDSLGGLVDDMAVANNDLLRALALANATLDDMEDILDSLFDTNSGLVPSIENDLTAIERAPDGILPSTDTFGEVSDGTYGTTPRLLDSSMEGSTTEISALVTELTVIYNNVTMLPNFTQTGGNVMILNTTISDMLRSGGMIDNLLGNLTSIQDLLANYPSLMNASLMVTESVDLFEGVVDDLNRAIEVLVILQDLFGTLPNELQTLKEELEAVRVLEVILDAFFDITDQLTGVNETLLKLPSSLNKITNAFDDINGTVSDSLGDLDGMIDDITDANTTILKYLIDGTEYQDDMRSMSRDINATLSDYDLSGINATLTDAMSFLNNVDLNLTIGRVITFRSALSEVSLTTELSDALYAFQNSMEALVATLQRTVDPSVGGPDGSTSGDYILLQSGYCSNNVALICDVDGDCGGGTCTGKGIYRCANNGSIACSDDSDCTGSYCLVDSTVATTLHTQLVALSSSSGDVEVSGQISALQGLSSNNDLQLSSARHALGQAYDGITVVNLTDIRSMLDQVFDGISAYNATGATGDLDYNFADLGITAVIEEIEPLREERDNIMTEYYPIIEDYTSTMVALRSFLFDADKLQSHIANIAAQHLRHIWTTRGPSSMVRSIAAELDAAVNYFHDNQDGFKVSKSNTADDVGDEFEYLDRMGAYEVAGFGDMKKNGATYYLFRLFNESTVLWHNPDLMGIYANSENERYEDGDLCLLEKCEEHTQDVVHNSPMQDWHLEFPQMELSMLDGVEYSSQELMLLLWVMPLLLAGICLISLVLGFMKWSCSEKLCNSCFLTCLFCQLPFVLLLTALLFFLVIMFDSICDDWDVIGRMYIAEFGDEFCSETLGGNGTLSACTFDTNLRDSLGGGNITVTVDVLDWYGSLIQADCSGQDPLATMIRSVSDQVDAIPTDAVDFSLDKNSLEVRDPVLDIIHDAANNTGTVIHNFMYGLSEDVLTCETVSAVVTTMHSETCVSIVGPIAWIILPWYLLGWIMCCFGLPGALSKSKTAETHCTVAPDEQEDRRRMENDSPGGDDVLVDITVHYYGHDSTYFFINEATEGRNIIDSFSLTPNLPEHVDVTMKYSAFRSGDERPLPAVSDGNFVVFPHSPTEGIPLTMMLVWLEGPDAHKYKVEYNCVLEDGSRTVWCRNKEICPPVANRLPLKGFTVKMSAIGPNKCSSPVNAQNFDSESNSMEQAPSDNIKGGDRHEYDKVKEDFFEDGDEEEGVALVEHGRSPHHDDEVARI